MVSPDELAQQDQDQADIQSRATSTVTNATDLGAYIRQRWMVFRNHRNQSNNTINDRLLRAQRMFEGKYDPEKLKDIKAFGGSEVYSRFVATKCRGATSLLRDVYLGIDRPWDLEPQDDPPVPAEILANIVKLVATEAMTLQQSGQPVLEDQVHMRYVNLVHAAEQAARRTAMTQADSASDKIEDMLRAGRFYEALGEFLVDLPLFPFAVLKGPTVKMVPKLQWTGGRPMLTNQPQMFWERVNPFNFYWTPGASNIEEAEIIERKRLTRADLNDCLGLPGYDQQAVRNALNDYNMGLRDWLDYTDTEEAFNEARESPYLNLSHMIDALEYHGNVQGHMLISQGMDPALIPDPDRDYSVQSWVVGRWTIKTQLNPSPRQRVPYFITSFEKVPGTVIGHGLPDILEDVQEASNATLRALVNNMSLASGPQVVVNTDCLAPTTNADELYPWKRWRVQNDPLGNNQAPISFFQPQSNAQELLQVFTALNNLGDDLSAIPRYITGESLSGGAGRTASGLSMLMGNSQKVLQTVAANVDTDVLRPLLSAIYDMIMLTDTSGLLTGNEQVTVNGVHVTVQKETERQKQLQFLQITANPEDSQIVGPLGRARVLRALAIGLGLPDDIVPDDETMQQQIKAQQQQAAQQQQIMQWLAMHGIKPGPATAPAQMDLLGQGTPGQAAGQAAGNQPKQATPARLSDHAPPFNNFQQGPNQGVPTNGAQ